MWALSGPHAWKGQELAMAIDAPARRHQDNAICSRVFRIQHFVLVSCFLEEVTRFLIVFVYSRVKYRC